MTRLSHDMQTTMDGVVNILDSVMAIDLDKLDRLVQKAHECDIYQIDTPREPFPVTRQALRMIWMFRRNLETVDVNTEAKA